MACQLLRMIKIVMIEQFPPDLLTIGLDIQIQTRTQLTKLVKSQRTTSNLPTELIANSKAELSSDASDMSLSFILL